MALPPPPRRDPNRRRSSARRSLVRPRRAVPLPAPLRSCAPWRAAAPPPLAPRPGRSARGLAPVGRRAPASRPPSPGGGRQHHEEAATRVLDGVLLTSEDACQLPLAYAHALGSGAQQRLALEHLVDDRAGSAEPVERLAGLEAQQFYAQVRVAAEVAALNLVEREASGVGDRHGLHGSPPLRVARPGILRIGARKLAP